MNDSAYEHRLPCFPKNYNDITDEHRHCDKCKEAIVIHWPPVMSETTVEAIKQDDNTFVYYYYNRGGHQHYVCYSCYDKIKDA